MPLNLFFLSDKFVELVDGGSLINGATPSSFVIQSSQLFHLLGEMWSSYNWKWFLSHHFGLLSSGKLIFGLSTHMT